jgi:hypothetical protein
MYLCSSVLHFKREREISDFYWSDWSRSTETYLHVVIVAKWLFLLISLFKPLFIALLSKYVACDTVLLNPRLTHLPDEQLYDMLHSTPAKRHSHFLVLQENRLVHVQHGLDALPSSTSRLCLQFLWRYVKRARLLFFCIYCTFFYCGGPIWLFIRLITRNEVWVRRIRSFHVIFPFRFNVETLVLCPSWHFYVEIRLLT